MIYGDILRVTEKDCVKYRHPTRKRKFDLRNMARPSQQQLTSCFLRCWRYLTYTPPIRLLQCLKCVTCMCIWLCGKTTKRVQSVTDSDRHIRLQVWHRKLDIRCTHSVLRLQNVKLYPCRFSVINSSTHNF